MGERMADFSPKKWYDSLLIYTNYKNYKPNAIYFTICIISGFIIAIVYDITLKSSVCRFKLYLT